MLILACHAWYHADCVLQKQQRQCFVICMCHTKLSWESISSFLNELQAIDDSAVEGLNHVDNVFFAAKQHLLEFWLLRGQVWAPDHVAEFESIIASCQTENHGSIFVSTGMFNDSEYFLGTLQRGGVSGWKNVVRGNHLILCPRGNEKTNCRPMISLISSWVSWALYILLAAAFRWSPCCFRAQFHNTETCLSAYSFGYEASLTEVCNGWYQSRRGEYQSIRFRTPANCRSNATRKGIGDGAGCRCRRKFVI